MPDHFLLADAEYALYAQKTAGRWNKRFATKQVSDRIHILRRAPGAPPGEWEISRSDDNGEFGPFRPCRRDTQLGAVARIIYAGVASECEQWWALNRFLWNVGRDPATQSPPLVFVFEGAWTHDARAAFADAATADITRSDDVLDVLRRMSTEWQLKACVIEYSSAPSVDHSEEVLLEWLQSDHNLFSRLQPVSMAELNMAPTRTGAGGSPRLRNIHTHDSQTLHERLNDGLFYLLYRVIKANDRPASDAPFGLVAENLAFGNGMKVKFWKCPPEVRTKGRPEVGSANFDFRGRPDA